MCLLPQGAITYFDAGLPNITGTFGQRRSNSVFVTLEDTTGVFQIVRNEICAGWADLGYNSNCARAADFDASRCSPIYSNSTTVQPSAITVNYFIRAK